MGPQIILDEVRPGSRAAFWRETLADWAASGLAQVEYCQRHGLSLKIFRRYRSQLARPARPTQGCKEREPVETPPTFVEVARSSMRAEAEASSPALEVRLSNGRRIAVGAGFDRGTLVALIEVLESC